MATELNFKYKGLTFTAVVNYTAGELPFGDDPGSDDEIEFISLKYGDIDVEWMLESDHMVWDLREAALAQIDKEVTSSKEENELDAYLMNHPELD